MKTKTIACILPETPYAILLIASASGVASGGAAKANSKMSVIDTVWCDWDRSSLLE